MPPIELVKITIPLPKGNLLNADTESVWAEAQADGTYRIDNVPYLARGISCADIVEADKQDGTLVFRRVLRHSGHSTYRLYAKEGWTALDVVRLVEALENMHCDVERATEKLIAIDVLPEADVYKVYALLNEAERAGTIDFEEGHCGGGGGSSTGNFLGCLSEAGSAFAFGFVVGVNASVAQTPAAGASSAENGSKQALDLKQDVVKKGRHAKSCDQACQAQRSAAWAKLIADFVTFLAMFSDNEELLPEAQELQAEAAAARAAANAAELARLSGILRQAAAGKGNFGIGEATAAEADELGKAWVGPGSRVASDGRSLVSNSELRIYRPPAFKPNLGTTQANFEQKLTPGGQPISNAHLNIQ